MNWRAERKLDLLVKPPLPRSLKCSFRGIAPQICILIVAVVVDFYYVRQIEKSHLNHQCCLGLLSVPLGKLSGQLIHLTRDWAESKW